MDVSNQKIRARHRFRFSLRTLLLVMTLLAVALGYVAVQYKAVRDRERDISALKRAAHVRLEDDGQGNRGGLRAWLGFQEVSLVSGIKSDEAMKLLAGLDRLRSLTIVTGVTDAGLAHVQELTAIEELNVVSDDITEKGLQSVSHLKKNLKQLELFGKRVDNAALQHLASLTMLERLQVTAPHVTDYGLRHLAKLTNLRSLDLSGTSVTDNGLVHLKPLTSLEDLKFDGTGITYAGMAHLIVDLQGRDVLVALLAAGANASNTSASLRGEYYGPDLLPYLARLPKLEQLSIEGVDLGSRDLKGIGGLRHLKKLELRGSTKTDEALAPLREVSQLIELNLLCEQVADNELKYLKGFTDLRTLRLLAGTNVTGIGFEQVGALPALVFLDLGYSKVTDDTLEYLAPFTTLEALDLSGTSIDGSGLSHLSGLRNLKRLNLSGTKITDDSLVHLSDLLNLEDLDLGGTPMLGDGLKYLQHHRNLRVLSLYYSSVGDAAIPYLKKMSWLQMLSVGSTSISPTGRQELEDALGGAVRD